MKKPLVILWIRRNKEYYTEDKIQGYAYIRGKSPPRSFQNRITAIERWNSLFKISYINFRKGLRKISEDLCSFLPVDRIFLWNDEEEFKNIPEGSWIFPMDEDDWINPDAFSDVVNNIYLYNNKNIIFCDICQKNLTGKISSFSSKKEGTSLGYFIKTPCYYPSVSHHHIDNSLREDNNYVLIEKKVAIKMENISSLSLFQHHKFLDFVLFIDHEIKNLYEVNGFEYSFKQYKKLLQKVIY